MSVKSEVHLPGSPLLRSHIELYRLIHFQEDVQGITIANGRLDMTILIRGKFECLTDGDNNEFEELPDLLVFPLTREGYNNLKIHAGSVMISIKLYPHVLMKPVFERIMPHRFLAWQELFGHINTIQLFDKLKATIDDEDWIIHLDDFFEHHLFDEGNENSMVSDVIRYIEEGIDVSLLEFSREHGVSTKTLERRFKKVTGLSTKVYQDLVKFQQAVKRIKNNGSYKHGNLLEALGVGYYDQSHFVKTCRKLTSKSPKMLFDKLPTDLTDFMYLDSKL